MIILQWQARQRLRILQKRISLLLVTPRKYCQSYGQQRADHEEPHDHACERSAEPSAWIAKQHEIHIKSTKKKPYELKIKIDAYIPVDLYDLRADAPSGDDPVNLMLSLLSCEHPSLCVGESVLSPFAFSLSAFLFLFLDLPSLFVLVTSLSASPEICNNVMHDLKWQLWQRERYAPVTLFNLRNLSSSMTSLTLDR